MRDDPLLRLRHTVIRILYSGRLVNCQFSRSIKKGLAFFPPHRSPLGRATFLERDLDLHIVCLREEAEDAV